MATSGVGMLAQVLGSTLEANRRNAMWQAEQQQQNEMAEQSQQAARENLATQLKAHLMSQLIADATKNVAMAQSEDRWAQRERERDAAAAAALAKQEAHDKARLKLEQDKFDFLKGEHAADRAAALERVQAPRKSEHRGYSITERRGDVGRAGGGGQEPDFRKTQEAFEADKITRVYLAQIQAAASMPAQQRVAAEAEAKKQFDAKMAELQSRRSSGPVAPAAPPVVNNMPSMYLRQPQAPAEDDLFTVR